MTASRTRILAWGLGLLGAAGSAVALVSMLALGLFLPLAVINFALIASALLGALVASRQPRNAVGWLMCAGAIAGSLLFLPLDYGYAAVVVHHGSWPLGTAVLWIGAWGSAPSLGMYFPLVAVRFPDGKVPRRWRIVDWLAIAGTLAFAISVALAPDDVIRGFVPSSNAHPFQVLRPLIYNPIGSWVPEAVLAQVRVSGLGLIVLGYAAAVLSVADRFRGARGDQRLQLQWFAYSGALMAGALAYGLASQLLVHGINVLVTGRNLGDALIPLTIAALSFPVSIGVAILRYRLYDIDLIINRTLVYGSLTAILGAVYAAVVTLLNRLFISVSGQRSDAAYVITAFVVVVASSPVKDWLQRQVDRRYRHASPATVLDGFMADVEAVVSVIDVNRVARRLLDEAMTAFDARAAAVYLDSKDRARPVYSRGQMNGEAEVEVPLRFEDRQFGRLVLGSRRGDIAYTEHDREVLQRSADSAGEALALASHLGFQPLARSH